MSSNPCEHGHASSYTWPLTDAQGIPLSLPLVCDTCEDYWMAEARKKYRPEILDGYSQEDVDEDIDEDR
jgi:hypothetical protein